jgi:diguanylate cyclase (GGDEF)-like protein/PAS domain S-box-containing protein
MHRFSWIALWWRRGRRLEERAELSFAVLADAAPAILWTAQRDGSVDFISDTLYQFTGLTRERAMGWGWADAVHPDDAAVCKTKWEHSLRVGEPQEVEYRLRGADGSNRWFLVKGNPVRDQQGTIVRWIGTCLDIEEQRHYQQILEQQIKKRTEELAEANTRLQEEMWEKDLARRKLDEQNEKMLEHLTARSQRATLLAQMGELLQSCMNNDEIFAAALGFAPKIFPTRRGFIALLNAGRDLAEIAGQWHDCQPRVAFEPGSCWALRTGKPHLVVAGDTTAPCSHAAGVKNTYLCIPILAQGEALGILHFQATDEDPALVDWELSLKTTFAGQVGLSVANIRLREALRTQSIKDPLTGLYNRRYLEETMERETRRALRAEQGLGVLMLDLDHFRKFNDTHGHDAGDTVLRETASFLLKSVRAEDIVCRFGGEEFVVILPVADLRVTQARAERIRSRLRELTVMHQGQSLGMVTVSIGVAELRQHGSAIKELLEAADAALYRAKRDGRDRVVVAETPVVAEVKLT